MIYFELNNLLNWIQTLNWINLGIEQGYHRLTLPWLKSQFPSPFLWLNFQNVYNLSICCRLLLYSTLTTLTPLPVNSNVVIDFNLLEVLERIALSRGRHILPTRQEIFWEISTKDFPFLCWGHDLRWRSKNWQGKRGVWMERGLKGWSELGRFGKWGSR